METQRLSLTGSFAWKVTTGEITWSDQLYRIYELEIGVPVTLELIRTRVHPEDVSLLEKMQLIARERNDGDQFEWQYRLKMPDRSTKFMLAIAQAMRDRDGRVEYIAAVQDVTKRRQATDGLQQGPAAARAIATRSLVSVVDDDESVREALPDLLRQVGFAAEAFPSAEAFLASDAVNHTSCLLLDVSMTGMSGPDLQQALAERGQAIPIVFITASGDRSLRSRLIANGAVDCLFKPFSDTALFDALDAALRMK